MTPLLCGALFCHCSKLHPEMGQVLLAAPPPGSSNLPAVLRLCGKLDLLDQVWGQGEDERGWGGE